MKRTDWTCWTIGSAALLLTGLGLASAPSLEDTAAPVTELSVAPEPVDSFKFFGRLDSWRAVDRDTLIVWTTAFRPYLIELGRPSPKLRFAHIIGISSTVGRVHSRLDEVYVDGLPYRIKSIYRLSPAQARSWQQT